MLRVLPGVRPAEVARRQRLTVGELLDLALKVGQRALEYGAVSQLPDHVRDARELVVHDRAGAIRASLHLRGVTGLAEARRQRFIARLEHIDREQTGLAQVTQG